MVLEPSGAEAPLLHPIKSRRDSPDYQERLGVINLIRRDFEEMSEMLGGSGVGVELTGPRIERIVLYIDDLDRCSSKRVVEVLEAIHLILAIPLFVVVAVDPRWLIKSLELHHSDLLSSVIEDRDPGAESHWTATPINYLEKIIQIPFTLRAMSDTGYADLMGSLIPTTNLGGHDVPREPSEHRGGEAAGKAAASTASLQSDGVVAESSTGSADLQEPEVPAARPVPIMFRREHQPIEVTDDELRFLKLLRPLVDTPRAAKKLANTYRLVRAGARGSRLERFVGSDDTPGQYRSVAVLLAVVIGRPLRALRFFQVVEDADDTEVWLEFLEDLRPRRTEEADDIDRSVEPLENVGGEPSSAEWMNRIGPLDDRERDAWQSLIADLEEITAAADKSELTLPSTLEPFRAWMYDTARFSFQTGRLVAQRSRSATSR